MKCKRVDETLLKSIKGYEDRKAYVEPFTYHSKETMNYSESSNIKEQVKRDKIVDSLKEAIKKAGIKDGMTISFHHHFRAGDKLIMQVVEILSDMGIKDLRIAASSLTSAHDDLVKYIKAGVVDRKSVV